MTDCDRIRGSLAEYVVGALHGRAKARVEAHLRDCASCRQELAPLQRTEALLDSLIPESAPDYTWRNIRGRISERAPAAQRPRPRLAWAFAVGAVALVMIVIGLTFVLRPFGDIGSDLILATEPDDEMLVTIESHLPTTWAAPLADEAAVGLRFAYLEEDG